MEEKEWQRSVAIDQILLLFPWMIGHDIMSHVQDEKMSCDEQNVQDDEG